MKAGSVGGGLLSISYLLLPPLSWTLLDGDGLTVLKTVYWAGGPVVPSAQSTVLPDTGPDTPDLLTIIPHSPLLDL